MNLPVYILSETDGKILETEIIPFSFPPRKGDALLLNKKNYWIVGIEHRPSFGSSGIAVFVRKILKDEEASWWVKRKVCK